MATEILIGVIGFGTAVVGLVTAYVSRTRRVIHLHEHPVISLATPRPVPEVCDFDLEIDRLEPDAVAAETTGDGEIGGNKYGRAAIRATQLVRGSGVNPPDAWEAATAELFKSGSSAQRKVCPKNAFLGLCQSGYVAGIPTGDYSRSEKNCGYAVAAAELLAREPQLADDWPGLWQRVLNGKAKQHNSQMHVVIALWRSGLLAVPVVWMKAHRCT